MEVSARNITSLIAGCLVANATLIVVSKLAADFVIAWICLILVPAFGIAAATWWHDTGYDATVTAAAHVYNLFRRSAA